MVSVEISVVRTEDTNLMGIILVLKVNKVILPVRLFFYMILM
jgi:hypothetical protein